MPMVIVSIPIGFSNELQRTSRSCTRARRSAFQSLSGFPMSCNTNIIERLLGINMFQSLSGFPMSCNILLLNTCSILFTCFNPYRVFQ